MTTRTGGYSPTSSSVTETRDAYIDVHNNLEGFGGLDQFKAIVRYEPGTGARPWRSYFAGIEATVSPPETGSGDLVTAGDYQNLDDLGFSLFLNFGPVPFEGEDVPVGPGETATVRYTASPDVDPLPQPPPTTNTSGGVKDPAASRRPKGGC